MKRLSVRHRIRGRKRSNAPQSLNADPSDQDYRVGPGRPPKEYQFKPGQSGNPKGARRKPRSIALDLKALFERALNRKVTLRQGEQQKIFTKAAAGIEQLVNQFVRGDRHARRDLLVHAERFGVDLVAGQGAALEQTVAAALSVAPSTDMASRNPFRVVTASVWVFFIAEMRIAGKMARYSTELTTARKSFPCLIARSAP